MKISSKFLALLLGGAVLVAGCEEKNTGNGKNEGNNGEQAVLFLDGSASETIEIGGESQTKTLQVALSKALEENCGFTLEVDESLLGGRTLLPANLYSLEGADKITAGATSAEKTLTVKTHIVSEDTEYALPLKLAKAGEGDFVVDEDKASYVLVVKYAKYEAPDVTDGLAMFSGRSGLVNNAFNQELRDFTFEIRFQIENFGRNYAGDQTVGRNRDVFYFGGHVIARFEDPNNSNTPGLTQHSQVQFQGGGDRPNCFNPAYRAEYSFEAEKWQHLAITHNSEDGQIYMYMNGQRIEMEQNPGWFKDKFGTDNLDNYNFQKLSIMGGAFAMEGNVEHQLKAFDYWGDCKVLCSEARIWSVARSGQEIADNLGKSVDPNSEGLVGYWNMTRHSAVESDGKTIFRDLTGNGHDLETTQAITWIDNASAFVEATPWPAN